MGHVIDSVAINQRPLLFQKMWCCRGVQHLSGNIVYVKKVCTSKLKRSKEAAARRRIKNMSSRSHLAETPVLVATRSRQRIRLAKRPCSYAVSTWQLPLASVLGLQHFILLQHCLVRQGLSQVQLLLTSESVHVCFVLVLANLVPSQSHVS